MPEIINAIEVKPGQRILLIVKDMLEQQAEVMFTQLRDVWPDVEWVIVSDEVIVTHAKKNEDGTLNFDLNKVQMDQLGGEPEEPFKLNVEQQLNYCRCSHLDGDHLENQVQFDPPLFRCSRCTEEECPVFIRWEEFYGRRFPAIDHKFVEEREAREAEDAKAHIAATLEGLEFKGGPATEWLTKLDEGLIDIPIDDRTDEELRMPPHEYVSDLYGGPCMFDGCGKNPDDSVHVTDPLMMGDFDGHRSDQHSDTEGTGAGEEEASTGGSDSSG